MKRLYIFLLVLSAASFSFAQQNVSLRINHKLGANPFQFGATAANNNGVEFTASRLDYYISQITLIHDGGMQTSVDTTWMLVHADQPTLQALGSFNVTSLEGVRFYIGVQNAYNHLNPTGYTAPHPLALQSPSMHWGWSSGYLFVAMNGNSGNNFVQSWEIHGLEDANYYSQTITTSGTVSGQDLIIDLDADYELALRNIDVSTGPINHGGTGIARTILQNFRDHVFSPAVITGVEVANAPSFSIFPNPASGTTRLQVAASTATESSFVVYDYTGRIIKTIVPTAGIADLNIAVSGCYLVALQQDGQTVATQRLVIAQ
ncbi:MAG: T9SS type A sorting domain-containing protein [Bacteroidetes bacterium]|nr:T9SS type A sorting domain-containing protein [Bacteroidota bacterium]